MKRALIILGFLLFVTFLASSCVAGLRSDPNYNGRNNNNYYRDDPNLRIGVNQNNGYRRGLFYRNRGERNNRYYRRNRAEQPVLIIR